MRRTKLEYSTKLSTEYRTATFAKRVLCAVFLSEFNLTIKNKKMGATTQKTFKPKIQHLNSFAIEISNDEIKKEPMFFNTDLKFAYENGGEITKSFIDNLPEDWKENVVFDSRVHMLMPKWYPAIPGWHHDDVPRALIPTGQHFITGGQPNYDNPRYQSEHIMGLVNAEICPTQFINTECVMPPIPEGALIYRKWHTEIEKLIAKNKVEVLEAKDRTLIYFDCNTFHTGIGAKTNGWRWFGRVSKNTDRVNKITNEIRVNCQVYLEFPMEGW